MNVAIIAAAGQGTRLAGKRPKQFLTLAGTPILIHTLKVFERCDVIHEIIVVVAAEETKNFRALAEHHVLQKIKAVVAGGSSRAESVLHGLRVLDPEAVEIVAVHDGVRPFVTCEEITNTVEAAKVDGAAILVSRPVDTVKAVAAGTVKGTLQRSTIRNALTPQCFHYKLLVRAYEQVDLRDPELTDESSLVERLGSKVAIVEGSPRNIKITRPEDLLVAEALLEREGDFPFVV